MKAMKFLAACMLVLMAAAELNAQTSYSGSSVSGNSYNYSRSRVDMRLNAPTNGGYSGQVGPGGYGPPIQGFYRPGPRGPIYYYPQWEGDSLSVGDSYINMGRIRMVPVQPVNPYRR